MKHPLQLQFLGANRQVTGSRYLLRAGGLNIMIDCGMFQERPYLDRNWEPSPIDPADIDVLLLTHAHLDHCGLIPKLVREGYAGPIHATAPSIDLARIVLEDAARLQEEDAAYKAKRHKREGRRGKHPEIPLYTAEDATASFKLFKPVQYDKPVKLNEHVSVIYKDAGHILGSAVLELHITEDGRETRIVFSGDIGQYDAPLMHDPAPITGGDYIVMESTYGDRVQEAPDAVDDRLAEVVNAAVERGGKVIIPTFAIDRAQDLLFHFSELVHANRIPDIPIFLDSPMALDVTDVFKRYMFLLDEATQQLLESGKHPFHFQNLRMVRTAQESKTINSMRKPSIIMAGAGMCTGGRVKHHLTQNISREEATVLFVGYQSHGTLGREIVNGTSPVRIHGKMYEVKAHIERIDGMSAHADRNGLLRWLGTFESTPQQIFLTHGEEEGALTLAKTIKQECNMPAHVPEYGESIDLLEHHDNQH
jgi:metallo-beta-lactamase family protein